MLQSITISDEPSGSRAVVVPELGFNCIHFSTFVGSIEVDVIDADPDFLSGDKRPTRSGVPILFPFPNRIKGGKFTWDGKEYSLPQNDRAGNAIHGFCLDRPWRVVEQGPNFVLGEFQLSVDAPDRLEFWPADYKIQVRYTIAENSLKSFIHISNPDTKPLPWGFGTHAYFKLPLSNESESKNCLVQIPVYEQWELENCLPTGKKTPLPEDQEIHDGAFFNTLKLDDVYTGLQPIGESIECVVMDEQAGLQMVEEFDTCFRELVAFTPEGREVICMEPYTCVTDAINLQAQGLDTGWQVLPPGEEFSTWINLRVEPIVA